MKSIRRTTFIALVLLVGTLAAHSKPNGPNSNSMRYSVDAELTATGVDADASGRVQALQRRGSSAEQYRLRISAAGLDPHTPYTVLAQLGDNPTFVAVTNFTTSGRGSGRVVYVSGGHGKRALPESMDAVLAVCALAVANTNGEIVLMVDLHKSKSMRFELTSIFENTGTDMLAIGCVAVACQDGGVQFRLFAGASSSQLTLLVNGNPVETYNADVTGRISVGLFPAGAPSPLDFQTLSLRNSADVIVLQSEVR